MRDFFRRILGSSRLDRRDWTVLLLSLLIAFSIWFLHNMSQKYSDFVTVPVRLRSSIEGRAEFSSGSSEVSARCRMIGFNLLGARMSSHRSPRTVTVDPAALHLKSGDTYYMTTKDLQEYAHLIFGESATLEYYVSDTVFFRFPAESHKKVPVVFNGEFLMEPQYTLVGDIRFEPDSIVLYGETSVLDKVSEVPTAWKRRTGIKDDIGGVLKLSKIKHTRMSAESVRYSARVSRYVEMTRTLPVKVKNLTGRNIITMPSSVEVTFKVQFPYAKDPLAGVEVYVDYRDFLDSRTGKCMLKARGMGESVISYTPETEIIECIAQ